MNKDAIEVVSPDHRIMTSRCLGPDGEYHPFMTAHYRRKACPPGGWTDDAERRRGSNARVSSAGR